VEVARPAGCESALIRLVLMKNTYNLAFRLPQKWRPGSNIAMVAAKVLSRLSFKQMSHARKVNFYVAQASISFCSTYNFYFS
jgi:hypothetical protein